METNPLLDQSALKTRYRDYLREIEHEQLSKQFKSSQPKLYYRLLARLGSWLEMIGHRLKAEAVSASAVTSQK